MAIGFYTFKPFWCDEPLEPSHVWDTAYYRDAGQIQVIYQAPNLKVHCRRDGMIIINIESLETAISKLRTAETLAEARIWSNYLNNANAFQLLLDSQVLRQLGVPHILLSELSVTEIARMELNETGDSITRSSFPAFSYAENMYNVHKRYQLIDRNKRSLHDPRGDPVFSNRFVLPSDVLSNVCEVFIGVLDSPVLLSVLAQLAKAVHEYKIGNFEFGLITSWFIIERLVRQRWNDFLGKNAKSPSGEKRISKKRRDVLTGRDFTMSVTTNVLELLNEIDYERFRHIDSLRKKRNDIVHSLSNISLNTRDLKSSFDVISMLLKEEFDLDWMLNPVIRKKLF